MKIVIPIDQRHRPEFGRLQVKKIIILSNGKGNPEDRTLTAEIVAEPIAEPMPEHFIYADSQEKTIKIPDLWGYLMANPETAFYLLSALANVIADQVPAWSGATLEVPE
jgi:hypothetical protein